MTEVRPIVRRIVKVAASWADAWVEVPNLEPLSAVDAVGPNRWSASFRWRYAAEMKQPEAGGSAVVNPVDLHNQYVQIGVDDGDGYRALWTGIIDARSYEIWADRDARPQGVQTLAAYGLDYLLDRSPVIGAWAFLNGESKHLDVSPTFNRRATRGLVNTALGNRADTAGGLGVYEFGDRDSTSVWSNGHIINYLLKRFTPEILAIELSGQTEILDKISGVYELEGLSVFQCLNQLIPSERGVGWTLRTDDAGQIKLHVFSALTSPVTAGGVTIDGNAEPVPIAVETGLEFVAPKITVSHAQQFDKLIVQGRELLSCCTLSYTDDTLEKAWPDALETEYKVGDAANPTDEVKNDKERKKSRFETVYTLHRVPIGWNGIVGIGPTEEVALPTCNADGTIDDAMQSALHGLHTFERQLPIVQTDVDNVSEYMKPVAFIQEPTSGEYIQTDLGGQDDEGDALPAASVRMLDGMLGVQVKPSKINHLYALNHFDPDADGKTAEGNVPVYDYETLIVTVALRIDQRPRFEKVNVQYPGMENPRVLVLTNPNVDYWYVAPGTVTGWSQGEFTTHEGGLVRNDIDLLEATAALAWGYYGRPHVEMSFGVVGFSTDYAPGQMLQQGYAGESIAAIVTRRSWDFTVDAGVTQIEAGRWQIDPIATAQIPGIGDKRALRRRLEKLIDQIDKLEAAAGNQVDRPAADRERIVPRLYQTTADAADGEVTIKAIDSDGNVFGQEFTVDVID